MDFVTFKIKAFQKSSFGRAFEEILKEGEIICRQWEFQPNGDFTIAEIPKVCVDQMTIKQIELLKEFIIDKE